MEAREVFKELVSLGNSGSLTKQEQQIWNQFLTYWKQSTRIYTASLKILNSKKTDILIDSLLYYQYVKLLKITSSQPHFESLSLIDPKGDSITLRNYFNKWTRFEGFERNEGMTTNVLNEIERFSDRNILVLTGYKHRSFIYNRLKEKQEEFDFELREFYD